MRSKPLMLTPLLLALSLTTPAWAAPIVVELSAEASRPATNDLIRATVAAEASGNTPAELAKQVNSLTAEALKTAKTYPAVTTQSSGATSAPIYAKGGKIESWRMRSELALESSDSAALSELLGRLQQNLGVSSLTMQPSAATRKKAEDRAMIDAIGAFKARAGVIAEAMGKTYRITQLSVNTSGRIAQPMVRGALRAMAADAVPMPVEAGESQVTATVSGQIELE